MTLEYFMDTARGKERLSAVFWYYQVCGNVALVLVAVLLTALADIYLQDAALIFAVIVIVAPIIVYQMWVLVSLWNCAFNVRRAFWGYASRLFVCYAACQLVLGLFEAVRGQ
jgi:hypothetical protein